jgi:thioredoxin reductase (NADPH)
MYDVTVIGSGCAGYTAAIYASRAYLKTVLLSGPQPGGQLTTTTEIDNFPGFPTGIQGPKLMEDMRQQAERFGAKRLSNRAVRIASLEGGGFSIQTDGEPLESRAIIVATGAQAKSLGNPTEDLFRGKGISYCATCDGFFFRGKRVAVVGGGDAAMEEATYLSKLASEVTIIHRRDTFRASAIMLDEARKDPKIRFLTNRTIAEFTGDTVLRSLRLTDTVTHKQDTLDVDGVFVAIGHDPATAFVEGFLERDREGYIVITHPSSALDPHTATSVPGVFAAGDCADPRYRQGTVAAGMGAMAAIDAERWLLATG